MAKQIVSRVIAVSYIQDRSFGREMLTYSPAARGDDVPPPVERVRINSWATVRNHIQQVRKQVADLIHRAVVGQKRGNNQLDAAAAALASCVLPRQGVAKLLQANMHPQFDIIWDAAAEIPWETLEEPFLACPRGHRIVPDNPGGDAAVTYCKFDGMRMSPGTGKLALDYHITHLVRGEGGFSAAGKAFLFIMDPDDTLCQKDRDPAGVCKGHLTKLQDLVKGLGYDVRPVSGPNATRGRVLEEIAKPDVAGIYYFGHGYLPRGGDEGCLLLADESLWASEIKDASPGARFVFLNACEGAASGANWDLDRRAASVAEAFAPGSGKVVIAPLWPVVNTQAAETATIFFENAAGGMTLAESLEKARTASYGEYEKGEPHISWAAYRYFGDPNRTLSPPSSVRQKGQAVQCRVFTEEGHLNTELFAFDIDSVLLRAAKRRNLQERSAVTFTDLLAGMVRRGDLTRFLLRQQSIDPDAAYDSICKSIDGEPPDREEAAAAGGSRAGTGDDPGHEADRWVIRDKTQMSPPLVEALICADRKASDKDAAGGAHRERSRVNEADMIEALCESAEWEAVAGLPDRAIILASLLACMEGSEVDANGQILLDRLDGDARKVIETAHVLAQQRGVSPITNRLFLAALLADRKGYAARIFRRFGLKSQDFFALMLAATKEDGSRTFGLSPETCGRIVLPVIHAAGQIAGEGAQVGEKDLFRAFCREADPAFKDVMRAPELACDLDAMESVDAPEEPEEETDTGDVSGDLQGREAPGGGGTDGDTIVPSEDFDDDARRVIAEAARLAREQGHSSIRSPHLLAAALLFGGSAARAISGRTGLSAQELSRLALSAVGPGRGAGGASAGRVSRNAARILLAAVESARSKGRAKATVEDILAALLAHPGVPSRILQTAGGDGEAATTAEIPGIGEVSTGRSILSSLGRDLTEKCRKGEIGEIVGRDNEIETAMQTLLLTESANPLLVGEAGVGKTAIVEGIALRIARGRCPARLKSMRVIDLPAGALVADTSLRGQFERRMQEVLAEAREGVILFVDEMHTIVGAGSAEGSQLDVANMLKSALARGELHLIGATTPSEYRKTIARDKALSRRFQIQVIEPPSREATIQVLSSRQAALETHHGVRIDEEAKAAAVDLSKRYIVDKQWPAKARDLLDRACALASSTAEGGSQPVVTSEHVSRVVSALQGIPLERITATEEALLASLEERVSRRIVGQGGAVKAVADAIRRGRRGLAGANRPWGVFLFVGPPGVGKTELAKVVAEEVYGGPERLIRFDMGEFTEPHATAKLLGAPPSYVGYGEGAPLVERLRKRPYSLILFDEIEHAHHDVMAVLLRLLSEGTVEDIEGNVGDARNAIVIMTTNVIDNQRAGQMGFARRVEEATDQTADKELRGLLERFLPAKLIDRIDAIVGFRSLDERDLAAIAGLRIGELAKRTLQSCNVNVEAAPEVLSWLAAKVAAENAGARGIQRVIDNCVASPLNELIVSLASREKTTVHISVSAGGIVVRGDARG